MCGLAAAIIDARVAHERGIEVAVQRMCERMRSRGPDASGQWHDRDRGVALGHRRLAILDLEARANQPMISEDGRFVILLNGEIYNFRTLRAQLEAAGERFRTQSDTEVLLKLYARDGEKMLPLLRGMFAIVIWDRDSGSAFIARDPYGIKPLYVAHSADGYLIASQVKALLASGLVSDAPDVRGQAEFWMLGSVPEPRTWYRDITALPSGSWSRIRASSMTAPARYWDIGDSWRNAPACDLDERDISAQVRAALLESVRHHLVADVPVGVFLSGGVDSGSLAGLMRDAGAADIQGITIVFEEFAGTAMDEAPGALALAQRFGLRHHVRKITRAEFELDLPRILDGMDQPSIDGINTWYASKAAAEAGMKVVVSGVGGDELFYGYPHFQQVPALVAHWNRLSWIPGLRSVAGALMHLRAWRSGNPRWRWLARQAGNLYGAYWLRRGLFSPDELPKLIGADMARELAPLLEPHALIESIVGRLPADSRLAIGQLESMSYLRNQLLRDSDWASMEHSVELRTPLVDAWLLRDLAPVLSAFDRVPGKMLLGRAPSRALPDLVTERPKTGFCTPVERWFADADGRAFEGGSRGWARHVAQDYRRAG